MKVTALYKHTKTEADKFTKEFLKACEGQNLIEINDKERQMIFSTGKIEITSSAFCAFRSGSDATWYHNSKIVFVV